MKNLALVLSGGGIKGSYHAGFIKGLEEHDIIIDGISGTSAGAITGSLYAAGVSPETMLEILSDRNYFNSFLWAGDLRGLFKFNFLEESLEKYLGDTTFEELPIPLYVCAADIINGEPVYFESGEVKQCVQASSAIPVIIKPVEIGNITYVDGGIFDNLPTKPLVDKYDTILGIHVNKYEPKPLENSISETIERVISLGMLRNVKAHIKDCTHFVEPNLNAANFDFDKAPELYAQGLEDGRRFAKNPEEFRVHTSSSNS